MAHFLLAGLSSAVLMSCVASAAPVVIRLPSGLPEGTDATAFWVNGVSDDGNVISGTVAGGGGRGSARRWVIEGNVASGTFANMYGSGTTGEDVSGPALLFVGNSLQCELPNWCEDTGFVCNQGAGGCYTLTPLSSGHSTVSSISKDGLTIIGTRYSSGARWSRSSPSANSVLAPIPRPFGVSSDSTYPVRVNRAGTVAVGWASYRLPNGSFEQHAVRWQIVPGSTDGGIPTLIAPGSSNSRASALDITGNIVAGVKNGEPFVWTQGSGITILPYTGNTSPVNVTDMAEDARVILGQVLAEPVVWLRLPGQSGYQMFRVRDILAGAGIVIADATLINPGRLCPDGSCLTMSGRVGTTRAGWQVRFGCSIANGPIILQAPTNQNACGAGPLVMSVSATGASLQYRWSLNGQDLVNGPRPDGSRVSGAFTSELRIFAPDSVWAGTYQCRVTGNCSETLTRPALVTLCRADFNCDAVVDFFDYLDFVDAFAGRSPVADYTADGMVDLFDYLDFVELFAAGCS